MNLPKFDLNDIVILKLSFFELLWLRFMIWGTYGKWAPTVKEGKVIGYWLTDDGYVYRLEFISDVYSLDLLSEHQLQHKEEYLRDKFHKDFLRLLK